MKQALKAVAAALLGAITCAAVFALWWLLWVFQPAIGVPM